MNNDGNTTPELYVPHEATIRVAGGTSPRQCASCAWHFLERAAVYIDFYYIGANAGQQATKAMSILSHQFNQTYGQSGYMLSFVPLRFTTITRDRIGDSLEETSVPKDCCVWRSVITQMNPEVPPITFQQLKQQTSCEGPSSTKTSP